MFTAHQALTSALVLSLALGGCGKKGASQPEASAGEIPSAAVNTALKAVPADAVFVLAVASPRSFWDLTVNQTFLPVGDKQATALDTAMRAHVDRHLGLDVSNVQSILVFATTEGGAAVIGPVKGSLKGAGDQDGVQMVLLDAEVEMVAALHDDTLLLGKRASVLASAATLRGEGTSFEGDFADFARAQTRSAYLAAAARLDKLPLPPSPFTQGLQRAGVKVDNSGIHIAVTGDPKALTVLKDQMKGSIEMALAMLKSQMDASSDDFAVGAGAILAYYNAQSLASVLEPNVDGDTLRLDVNLLSGGINSAMVVAAIGMLSAVAVPAFIKYTKKSKTAEASIFLKKISDSARTHYALPAAGSEPSFPASVGPTPPLGTCCATGEKCVPNDETWQHPTWQALDFAMLDPHYYSYEFKTETTDGISSYTALAYGDLDCDGVYSTFSLYGQVVDGKAISAADVIKQDALE